MSMSAVVYSRPGCHACRITLRLFAAKGVSVESRVVSDEDAVRFREAGHMALPVVEFGGRVWSGLRPDTIEELTA